LAGRLFDPHQYAGRRSGLLNKNKTWRTTMKASMIAAALMLAATTAVASAQAPTAGDPHHPPQSATPAPAPAQPPTSQPGMGMVGDMPMMNMMGGDMPMMNMMAMMRMMEMMGPSTTAIDRIEGRIAFLRAELNITEAQASAWNAFADAMRTNAKKLREVRASIMPQPDAGQQQALTMAERLDQQERWLVARLEGTRALKSAVTNLYGTLSEDQKKTANELLAPQMGMGMIAMMPGQGPGQMQPRQMQPGAK
jgi:LTXXQ motif family protein